MGDELYTARNLDFRDRAREVALAATAAAEGVAPALLYGDSTSGIMITRYTGTALRAEPAPGELAALLRAIHRIPVHGPALDSTAQLDRYHRLLPAASPGAALLRAHAALLAVGRLCRSRPDHPGGRHDSQSRNPHREEDLGDHPRGPGRGGLPTPRRSSSLRARGRPGAS